MQKLYNLKMAVIKDGRKQSEIAKAAGIAETYFSMAISGRLLLRDDEKKAIAKALHKPVAELFSAISV